jgi:YVTN family beta-propeller protein
MRTKSGWALALALLGLMTFIACSNSSKVSTSGFVWVATSGDQKLTSYSVNLTSGATSQLGKQVATGAQPSAMVMTPDGKLLFVANSSDNTVGVYTVNSDQTLKAAGSAIPVGQNPVGIAIDPSGKFLFVANQGTFSVNTSGTISVFTVSSLQQAPGSPFATEVPSDITSTGPSALVTSPAGNFLYVANQFTNTVGRFSYDPSTGALTSAPTDYAAGTNPSSLAFSRCAGFTSATTNCTSADSNSLFVANSGSNNISVFTACIQVTPTCSSADGSLLQVGNSPFGAGLSPVSLIVNPVSNFLYAVNAKSNEISQYQYNSATGGLTALSVPTVSASSPGP